MEIKERDDNPNDTDARAEKCQPVPARRLKVTWGSRVTGVHPLSTFMRIEVYRMFQYDAKKGRYRCFYAQWQFPWRISGNFHGEFNGNLHGNFEDSLHDSYNDNLND